MLCQARSLRVIKVTWELYTKLEALKGSESEMLPHLMQSTDQSEAAFPGWVKLPVIYPSLILLLICSVIAAISLNLCRKGKLLAIPGEQS
jgi:hypothetical protein